ncbi:MAG TPA: hypothetical protein VF473_03765, partial [Cyclobacteriaceae bacterium]
MKIILPFFTLVVVLAAACDQKPASSLSENSDLKIGETVGRKSLALHAKDSFKLDLKQSSFVFGEVEQHDVDVVVKIFDPGHKEIASFDGPARGPESFKFTTT